MTSQPSRRLRWGFFTLEFVLKVRLDWYFCWTLVLLTGSSTLGLFCSIPPEVDVMYWCWFSYSLWVVLIPNWTQSKPMVWTAGSRFSRTETVSRWYQMFEYRISPAMWGWGNVVILDLIGNCWASLGETKIHLRSLGIMLYVCPFWDESNPSTLFWC